MNYELNMPAPLAVTVIGGYLGAGKTTLVNHLLRQANGQRLAILVNEFGALPIDEDLIEAQSDNLISIAGGCICCSFGSDLTAALMELAGRTPRPDHVIIESSGVAMPGAIGASIGLLEEFTLAAIVVLADSETVQQHAVDEYLGDTTLRQLHDADLLVQTKIDLVDAIQLDSVRGWLEQTNPYAAVVCAEHGQVQSAVILGTRTPHPQTSSTAHADNAFESEVFTIAHTCCDVNRLAKALACGDYGVVRAKGFVTSKDGQSWLIQTVGKRHRVNQIYNQTRPEIVCIGLRGRLNKIALARLVSNFRATEKEAHSNGNQ